MYASKFGRKEGACVQCAMRKRKCDRERPQCSPCRKNNLICEPKTFKHYKVPHASKSLKSTLPHRQSQSPLRFENESCEDSIEYDDAIQSGDDAIQSGDDIDKLTCTEIQQGIKSTSLDRDTGIAHSPLESIDCSISPAKATALLPIPSNLQLSPQDSLLWSYFVVRGTKIFLCWDVDKFGLNELVDDPFTATFTSMAAHSTVLRPAAFALSAFLYSQDCPGALSSDDVAAFKHQALSAFEQEEPELKRKPIDFVLAGLVLQLVDGDRQIGFWELTRKAMRYLPDQADTHSRDVAMHLSRWMYICRQLSFSNKIELPDEVAWQDLEFHEQELETSLCRQFHTWIIHPLYTVSHRWINPLLKLSKLVRLRRDTIKPVAIELPWDVDKQVDELEEEIFMAREQDLLVFLQGSEDLADLLCLNEAIHAAITLVFWTRLRDLPWTNAFVRKQVLEVCLNIEAIGDYSRTLNNAVFPVFLAACEAVDLQVRDRIVNILNNLHPAGFWYHQQSKLIANLQHIWAIRDKMPGALWPEWGQTVLLCETMCIPV